MPAKTNILCLCSSQKRNAPAVLCASIKWNNQGDCLCVVLMERITTLEDATGSGKQKEPYTA